MNMENVSASPMDVLRRLIDDPAAVPSASDVEALEAAFPYMALPASLRLKRASEGMEPDERRRLAMRVAALAPGRDTLFRLLDPDGDLLKSFMPPEEQPCPTATSTDAAIDTFLDTYGRMDPGEEALLEKLIFNPVPDDYSALLAAEEGDDGGGEPSPATAPAATRGEAQDRLLDAFLQSAPEMPRADLPAPAEAPAPQRDEPQRRPSRTPAPAAASASSSLSESLAQVYIRRGRYDKAFDIIHALSLNNPKKSVYFADQMRFLQKLIRVKGSAQGPEKQ